MRRGLTVRKLSERKEGERVLNAEEEEGEEVQFKIVPSRVNFILEKGKSPSQRYPAPTVQVPSSFSHDTLTTLMRVD
jgi:hypothetical protein